MASALFGLTAGAYTLVAIALLLQRLPGRSNVVLAGACVANAAWAAALSTHPAPLLFGAPPAFDFLRTGAWFGYLVVLARRVTGLPRWQGGGALVGLLFGLATVLGALLSWWVPGAGLARLVVPLVVFGHIALAIGILAIAENLFRNAVDEARWHINLACIAVSGLFLYEIALYADAILHGRISPLLFTGQAPANLVVLPLLFLAARRLQRWKEDVGVSRSVVFHTATLFLSGIFLVGLAATSEVLRRFGTGWSMLAEASLIFAGCIVIAVLATSGRARSRLRRIVVDHFFARRYDYQHEWVRCIATFSAHSYLGLHRRVIRALAEIVDSPGGVLFLADAQSGPEPRVFRAAGSWSAPRLDGIVVTPAHPLLSLLRGGGWIAEATPGTPLWFAEFPEAWLAVPLPATDGAAGFVVLAQPRAPFELDREVFDLLRIVGQEVALFIAERQATEALAQARQFAEAGRRFSFVAHDIKNLAAQLSLLLGNAEQHLENPAFRADMLATLRGAVQRISGLLTRLQSPALRDSVDRPLHPAQHLAAAVTALHRVGAGPILLETDGGEASVAIDETAFDAVIRHLLDNALEASPPGTPVRVQLTHESYRIVIAISDQGSGMSDEFIRERLFRPFSSTKSSGFGLGAFQARALLREAGGDLTVMSAVGGGTCMRVTLPVLGAQDAPARLALHA